MDMVYFGAILRNIDGICGFDAQYDCPVAVTLYVDPSAAIPEKMLRDSIEVKEAHMLAHGGKVRAIPVHYELKATTRRRQDRPPRVPRPDVRADPRPLGAVQA